ERAHSQPVRWVVEWIGIGCLVEDAHSRVDPTRGVSEIQRSAFSCCGLTVVGNWKRTGFKLERGRHSVECLESVPGKILGMTVQVDEARCDDEPGDIDSLTGIRGVVADGHDAS